MITFVRNVVDIINIFNVLRLARNRLAGRVPYVGHPCSNEFNLPTGNEVVLSHSILAAASPDVGAKDEI